MATCKDFDTGSEQITQLCNLCDSNVCDGHCDECEDYMCRSCFDIHSRVRTCGHHVLLNDVCQKDNKKASSEPCERHLNQSIKFFCVGHKIVGCVECFFPEHRHCHYQNIEDAAKIFQDSGEDTHLKNEIHRLENTHSELTRLLEEDKETIAVFNNTVVHDVQSFTETVTLYVAQVGKQILKKLENLHMENETRLDQRIDDLDIVGTEIEKVKMQLENEDRVDRLFISAIEIGPVIEKLRKNITSIGNQHVIKKYAFQPNKLIMDITNGSGSFGEILILPVEPGNEPKHTEEKIFVTTDAESYRNLTIHVRTSKQSGKDTCYPFGCKTMDVYLRWKLALRETSIFKQVVKKLPIAQKYRLDIARQNAALLIQVSSGLTCTQAEALKIVSDVVDGIVKETKVYSCEGVHLEGDNSEKVMKEIRQSRLSSDRQLVEAYDQKKDKLWVLFHPSVRDHVMGTVEKARKTSKTKTNQLSETLRLNYCLHQRLNDKQFKEKLEQSFSSVEIKHEKMPEENEVKVTLKSETADTLQAAKIWIGKLEDNFSSLCTNYSDHGGHVSGDLMTEFLNMSFEKEDIKHETNEKVHKVWIWSWSLDQTDLDKRTSKARNHIKRDNVFKSVTLPTANMGMLNVIEKINKTFVQIVCKENEVVISGLCYSVDAILEALGTGIFQCRKSCI